MKILMIALTAFILSMSLVACTDGKAENFGEKVDNAYDDTKDAIGDAADDVSDGVEDAADNVSDSVEDACEKATNENC